LNFANSGTFQINIAPYDPTLTIVYWFGLTAIFLISPECPIPT